MSRREFLMRLMQYKRILMQLRSLGLENVFSNNLGDAVGISAAMVRKDMSKINIQGNRRGGYRIDRMLECLQKNLHMDEPLNTIVVGCGNLGRALLKHDQFPKDGITILAGFDLDTSRSGIGGISILPMDQLEDFIKSNRIKVAILAVPSPAAAELRDRLLNAGIQGILNFAPMNLKSSDGPVIRNVNIGLEVENLFYMVNEGGTKNENI